MNDTVIYLVIAQLLLFHFKFLSCSSSEKRQNILKSAAAKILCGTEIRTSHSSLAPSGEMCGLQGPGALLYNRAIPAHPLLQAPNVGTEVLLLNQLAVPAHTTQSSTGFAMFEQYSTPEM